jgi:hypothetical protein
MTDADIRRYFDPVCPFAWMTSKWVRMVAARRDYTVDWRFISLRLINAGLDYDSHFPAGYEEGTPRDCGCCGPQHGRGPSTGGPPPDCSTRPSAARSSTLPVPPS